jgi:hypothetical protein
MPTEPPEPPLVAYIDEAGDQGSQYGVGSSKFLVIGCAVVAAAEIADTLGVFEETRRERGKTTPIRKFSNSSEKDNFVLTKNLSNKNVRIIQVGLYKPAMAESFIRGDHKSEYFYLIKFAMERISWLARDRAKRRGHYSQNSKCRLVFSEQKQHSYGELCEYLNRLQTGKLRYNCSIEWDYLHDVVTCEPHANEQPIHLADIAASALHKAIEPKAHGMTDDRYQKNLHPALYRRDGRVYGLKLFPAPDIAQMRLKGELDFLKGIS